jgi:hypothetical protein
LYSVLIFVKIVLAVLHCNLCDNTSIVYLYCRLGRDSTFCFASYFFILLFSYKASFCCLFETAKTELWSRVATYEARRRLLVFLVRFTPDQVLDRHSIKTTYCFPSRNFTSI